MDTRSGLLKRADNGADIYKYRDFINDL